MCAHIHGRDGVRVYVHFSSREIKSSGARSSRRGNRVSRADIAAQKSWLTFICWSTCVLILLIECLLISVGNNNYIDNIVVKCFFSNG